MADRDDLLVATLEEARGAGFLGAGPIEAHLANAAAFAAAAPRPPDLLVDLGSGGGVPALALARWWPEAHLLLVEAMERRAAFLERAVVRLGLGPRVQIAPARAELVSRDPSWRGRADLVTARSFGSPAVTAECAVGFLADGAFALVSEPPDADATRWPTSGLATLGLEDAGVHEAADAHIRRLRRAGALSDRFPRRVGIPAKRPLW